MEYKIATQTFRFNREDKNKFFNSKKPESYWDFHKEGLIRAVQIIDDCCNGDFEVIIKAKENNHGI